MTAQGTTSASLTWSVAAAEGPAAWLSLLADAPREDVDAILAAARSGAIGPDPALWGPAPSRDAVAAASLANLRQQFEARRSLEAVSLTRAGVAALVDISEQAVTLALESRRLLGFKRAGRWVIPAWQLDAESDHGILPGLDRVASAFGGGIIALSEWIGKPAPDLGGRTPREMLAAGRVDTVVALAGALTAAGW